MIEVFLQPGEFFVGGSRFRVRTLLGSCVSITLWHPGRRFGAMSHFLLGHSSLPAGAPLRTDGRYGNDALRLMLARFDGAGVPHAECQATVIGGGNMFPAQRQDQARLVGHENGIAARRMLHQAGIPVVYENLFGIGHRQVLFDIATGQVWVRQLEPSPPAAPVAPQGAMPVQVQHA